MNVAGVVEGDTYRCSNDSRCVSPGGENWECSNFRRTFQSHAAHLQTHAVHPPCAVGLFLNFAAFCMRCRILLAQADLLKFPVPCIIKYPFIVTGPHFFPESVKPLHKVNQGKQSTPPFDTCYA